MALKLNSKSGFSLVELMIVVAIIGVLATIGVPTFRTMTQKARKSEAKVALGGLYTAEAAFNAEYSVYGNRLDRIGFAMEGAVASRIYQAGFMDAACASILPAAIQPTAVGVPALAAAYPAYYNNIVATSFMEPGPPTFLFAAGCAASDVAPLGVNYTASAAGRISTAAAAVADVWTMTDQRVLANVTDGVL